MHETNVVEACQEIMDYSYEKCYTSFQEALAEYPDPTWIDENCEIRDPEQLERVINPGKFFFDIWALNTVLDPNNGT